MFILCSLIVSGGTNKAKQKINKKDRIFCFYFHKCCKNIHSLSRIVFSALYFLSLYPCISFYLPLCVSLSQSVSLSVSLSSCLCRSSCLSVSLSLLSVSVSLYLSICLSHNDSLSICLAVSIDVYLSICLLVS